MHVGKLLGRKTSKQREKQYRSVVSLVIDKKWKKICSTTQVKESNGEKTAFETSWVDDSEKGKTVLHFACQLGAPFSVVERLTGAYPETITTKDYRGRLPLHIAVEKTASLDVFEHILQLYPLAASVQDNEGNTPLHLACGREEWPRDSEEQKTLAAIVKNLCAAAPASALVENNEGISPIEGAIVNGADMKTVRSVQRAAVKLCKSKSAETQQ